MHSIRESERQEAADGRRSKGRRPAKDCACPSVDRAPAGWNDRLWPAVSVVSTVVPVSVHEAGRHGESKSCGTAWTSASVWRVACGRQKAAPWCAGGRWKTRGGARMQRPCSAIRVLAGLCATCERQCYVRCRVQSRHTLIPSPGALNLASA